ncbi:MAG: Segregation and condensation protein B [Ktedonobacterales bacterium]|jgi:segregation and condensation protein B|nr:MAG: Segregation and condensation protein B [Ktedonobacterales bacterium]
MARTRRDAHTTRDNHDNTPNNTTATASAPGQVALPLDGAATALPASMLSLEQLRSALESVLFIAGRPLQMSELRRLLPVEDRRLREALASLAEECERNARGIRVQRMDDAVQLVSAPENARFVAALLGLPTQAKLTTAALETLAVVAYRQPITRSQIEFIRGVNSDRALSSLLQYGLVQEVGRAATVGRPVLFGTTLEFLQQFGLPSLEALPKPESPELQAIEQQRAAAAQRVRAAVGDDERPPAPPALPTASLDSPEPGGD